jgi:hypothetical protein
MAALVSGVDCLTGGADVIKAAHSRNCDRSRPNGSIPILRAASLKDGRWRNYCPRCAEEADPDLDLTGLHLFKNLASDD